MSKLIKKLFYNPAWVVACREIVSVNDFIPNSTQTPFSVLLPTENECYADSFCFEDSGRCFLFMEIIGRNGNKGTIGVTEFIDGHFSVVKEILREPFHLSYPNVFKHNDKYFMLPETNQSKQLRLYESTEFPYKWKLNKVLFDGANLVDTSFMKCSKDAWVMFSHDITNSAFSLRTFIFDLNTFTIKEIKAPTKASKERPGGNIICVNGEYFRILQDCSEEYGKRIKIYQIESFDCNLQKYSEKYFDEITIDKIPMNENKKFIKVHTFTRSASYEAIDSQYSRFYITKPFKKVVKRFLHK